MVKSEEGCTTNATDLHEWRHAPGHGSSFVTIREISGWKTRPTPALPPLKTTAGKAVDPTPQSRLTHLRLPWNLSEDERKNDATGF